MTPPDVPMRCDPRLEAAECGACYGREVQDGVVLSDKRERDPPLPEPRQGSRVHRRTLTELTHRATSRSIRADLQALRIRESHG